MASGIICTLVGGTLFAIVYVLVSLIGALIDITAEWLMSQEWYKRNQEICDMYAKVARNIGVICIFVYAFYMLGCAVGR